MPRKYIGPQIAVRIEAELLERIDALIPAFATAVHEPTRAEVVRGAVLKGLPVLEAEAAAAHARSHPADDERPAKTRKPAKPTK